MAPHLMPREPSRSYDLPPIPEKYDKTYKTTHYSEPDKIYAVNLFKRTCTCADYENRRSRFAIDDLRVICKHIVDKLKSVKLYQSYDSLTANLLHCSAYFGDDIFLPCDIGDKPYVLTSSESSPWVNVHLEFTPKSRNAVVRFGFNVPERKWQYQERPTNAPEIEKYILDIL
jgi:hypothetical protein